MLQRDGEVMMVLVMMMMIPVKPSSMTVTMAMIPPSGREFPQQIFACRRAFSLSQFSAPQMRRNISLMAPPVLGFWGDDIREGALAKVGQGCHTTWPRGLALPAPRGGVGPWWPTSASPSGYLHHLAK
jgi:hypothetical protein